MLHIPHQVNLFRCFCSHWPGLFIPGQLAAQVRALSTLKEDLWGSRVVNISGEQWSCLLTHGQSLSDSPLVCGVINHLSHRLSESVSSFTITKRATLFGEPTLVFDGFFRDHIRDPWETCWYTISNLTLWEPTQHSLALTTWWCNYSYQVSINIAWHTPIIINGSMT